MKRMHVILLIISTILITGCLEKMENNEITILGTWKWSGKNDENTFIFYKNNSFYSCYTYLPSNEVHKGWGTFFFNNSRLCMHTLHGASGSEENYCYRYIFSENNKKLTLFKEDGESIVLIRIS